MDISELIAMGPSVVAFIEQFIGLVTQAKAVASAADQPALDALLASLNGQREAAVAAADAALEAGG